MDKWSVELGKRCARTFVELLLALSGWFCFGVAKFGEKVLLLNGEKKPCLSVGGASVSGSGEAGADKCIFRGVMAPNAHSYVRKCRRSIGRGPDKTQPHCRDPALRDLERSVCPSRPMLCRLCSQPVSPARGSRRSEQVPRDEGVKNWGNHLGTAAEPYLDAEVR